MWQNIVMVWGKKEFLKCKTVSKNPKELINLTKTKFKDTIQNTETQMIKRRQPAIYLTKD